MFRLRSAGLLVATVFACAATGCGDSSQTTPVKVSGDPPPPVDGGQHDGHNHDAHGPHGGDLIELGKGKFHLELVHDDATETVTVYVLDAAAKDTLAIDANDLQLNLTVDGKPRQFILSAVAQPADPTGKSSCFRLTDKELCVGLDAKGSTGRVAVTIDDKPYSGTLSTSHDHSDDHKH
jgi:hypothetical protein